MSSAQAPEDRPDVVRLLRRRRALPAATLRRARAGQRRDRAVPRDQGGRRAAGRERLLLRLRPAHAVHARGPRAHRGPHARDRRRGPALRVRRDHEGRGPRALRGGGREVQAALPHPDPRGRQGHLLPQRPVPRPVPRPAPAEHREDQGLQGHPRGRRVLARERAQRDAPAHLRHRLPGPAGPGRAPEARRGGAQARPPAAGARAGPVLDPRGGRARARPLAPQGRDAAPPDRGLLEGRSTCAAATSSSTRRTWRARSSSRSPGTSRTTATSCTRRWTSTGSRTASSR